MLVALMIIYMQITRWHCGTVPKSAERADQPHTLLPHAFYLMTMMMKKMIMLMMIMVNVMMMIMPSIS